MHGFYYEFQATLSEILENRNTGKKLKEKNQKNIRAMPTGLQSLI
jgi:hypothetical protein